MNAVSLDRSCFTQRFADVITVWTEAHKRKLLNYENYRWGHTKTYVESVNERNRLELIINFSRKMNNGAVDLKTLDEVYQWGFGFGHKFPRSNSEAAILDTTRKAFCFLDANDCYNACKTMMEISWSSPHPAGATKILGLSNQEKFCIYDRRVGTAIADLTSEGTKLISCPSFDEVGDGYCGWAENYQKLIWTLEIIRDSFKPICLRTISQLEMALFMMGKIPKLKRP